jgi:hypothetical protein
MFWPLFSKRSSHEDHRPLSKDHKSAVFRDKNTPGRLRLRVPEWNSRGDQYGVAIDRLGAIDDPDRGVEGHLAGATWKGWC